jgi:tetratricopeptide (TPR) repeat protein
MVLDGEGGEVDSYGGFEPPGEKVQGKLQTILDGTDTFKALSAAYAKNPKDVETVFKFARKLESRDAAKALEKFKEVAALDPEGQAGSWTLEDSGITVPYTEYAEFAIATSAAGGQKRDPELVRSFLAKYPQTKLAKQVYERLEYDYGFQTPKEEAAKFFEEYASKFPNDPMVLHSWLYRIVRDKEPIDKGVELAAKIEEMTRLNPDPGINQLLAQAYALKGDAAKAEELYGKTFIEDMVTSLAYGLIGYAGYWLGQETNLESAVAMAEKALLLEPDNYYVVQQTANAYLKTGRTEKALAIYGPEYAQKIGADVTVLWQYASFWARQGKNLDSTLEAAQKATTLLPRWYLLWNTLSQVYEKTGNSAEAIKAKEKAIELAPDATKATYKKDLERIKAAGEKK